MTKEEKIVELCFKNKRLFFVIIRNSIPMSSNEDVKDFIQDLHIKLFMNKTFNPFDEKSMGYILMTLRSMLIDKSRKKKIYFCDIEDAFDIGKNIIDGSDYNSLNLEIEKILNSLELKIVKLLEFGYSSKEIDSILEYRDGHTRTLMFNMRNKLKSENLLIEYCKNENLRINFK